MTAGHTDAPVLLTYTAACPGCGADAEWVATSTGRDVSVRVECATCPPVAAEETPSE